MPKKLSLFCFLVINCFLFLFIFFLSPSKVLGQSGRVRQENTTNDRSSTTLNAKNLLRIENLTGNISIKPSQNNNIVFQPTQRNSSSKVSKENILIEENSEQAYLKVLSTTGSPIDISISVPEGTNLRLLSETGNIDVTFVAGSLVASSKTGNINLSISENTNADLSLSTTFGTVRLAKSIKTSNDTKLKSFHKQLGRGGSIITLYTEQGNINLETNNISQNPDIAFSRAPNNNPNNSSSNRSNSIPSSTNSPTSSTNSTNSNATNSDPILNGAEEPKEIGKRPVLRRNDSAENNDNTNSGANSGANTVAKGSSANTSEDEDGVIKIESQLVTLNATALTPFGQPVINLNQSDFLLYEDGVTQEIVHFQSVNTPFNLILLIDLSGSVKEKLSLIRRSAMAFIQATRPEDRVAIITFSGSTQLVCPLTNDRKLLRKKIEDIDDAESGTNFYDALVGSINWVLRQAKNQRNAIVIMSDGVDNSLPGVPGRGSRTTFSELIDRVQESDTIIFPIFLNTEEEVMKEMGLFVPQAYAISRQQLQTLADTTGGSIFYANQLSDLTGCYEKVAAELRTIYSLGYYPTNGSNDGGFRKIRLKSKRDDVKIKTRRGYYAKNT